MTMLPEEPEVTLKRRLYLELDENQVRQIIMLWAKQIGFSHRCDIEFSSSPECTISEITS
jgi:hypothetical protein